VERNAILGDMDPEAAKRLTEAITKLRESPTPIKTDDLPDALGSQSPPATSGE
jgi:flagellar motility protein MotE (MotC chaperone)